MMVSFVPNFKVDVADPNGGPCMRVCRGSRGNLTRSQSAARSSRRKYVHYPDATTSFALLLSFSCNNQGTVFNVTMSFGFGISDFITVLQLANQIRAGFVDAPDQFKAISDE
jgi:hypothetical protein